MRIPKYRLHSTRDFAFVEIAGERKRLPGRKNSTESRRAYQKLIARLMSQAAEKIRPEQGDEDPPADLTVAELVERFLPYAKAHYNGSTEYGCNLDAMGPLISLYPALPVEDFGPRKLRRVRKAMLAGKCEGWAPRRRWSRTYINAQVNRIRRMFRWGLAEELVPARVPQALAALPSLTARRASIDGIAAPERPRVKPVLPEHVDAVLPHLAPPVAAMVELQRITGMRSSNLCEMRPADIDRSGKVWLYVPRRHKSDWRDKHLFILLGPRCQKILGPFLDRVPEAFCFSPAEAMSWRFAQRRSARKTPLTPSQAARRPKADPLKPIGDHYDRHSYRQAVVYAIRRENRWRVEQNKKLPEDKQLPAIPAWTPHRLRHNVATDIRRDHGLEAAQVYLGHTRADVTQIYAERDLSLAVAIAQKIG